MFEHMFVFVSRTSVCGVYEEETLVRTGRTAVRVGWTFVRVAATWQLCASQVDICL